MAYAVRSHSLSTRDPTIVDLVIGDEPNTERAAADRDAAEMVPADEIDVRLDGIQAEWSSSL